MVPVPLIADFVEMWSTSPFATVEQTPWHATQRAEDIVRTALATLGPAFRIENEVAVHSTATVETGVVLKGPVIVGPRCFVATGAYLRGGAYLAENCIIGPACELKSAFMFSGSKIAHLSFVGDSILGSGVNVEAGAMLANYRNELEDKQIRIWFKGTTIETGVDKFGSLIGDDSRIGANAVIAPGALIQPGSRIGRLQLVDQMSPREVI